MYSLILCEPIVILNVLLFVLYSVLINCFLKESVYFSGVLMDDHKSLSLIFYYTYYWRLFLFL